MATNKKKYISLKKLEIYQSARKLSSLGWEFHSSLDWRIKKINGEQFITSVDSIGANIAEEYGRFHYLYLDKIKFYYNSRPSLNECNDQWLELLYEKTKIDKEPLNKLKTIANKLSIKLNNFIAATHKSKINQEL